MTFKIVDSKRFDFDTTFSLKITVHTHVHVIVPLVEEVLVGADSLAPL